MSAFKHTCPVCACPGELSEDRGFVPDAKLLGVADSSEIGPCPYCGVERCHVRFEHLSFEPGGVSARFAFSKQDGTVLAVDGDSRALAAIAQGG